MQKGGRQMTATEQKIVTALQSPIGKALLGSVLFLIVSYLVGYLTGWNEARKTCNTNLNDNSDLPNGGLELEEKKDSNGVVIRPAFTLDQARKFANDAYAVYETYNPFTKLKEDSVARSLLDLNDDQFALVCKVYAATFSAKLIDDIKDDYWGLSNWQDELLDTNTYKVLKRIEKLNLD